MSAVRLAALFNRKARFFVEGRRDLYGRISREYKPFLPVLWFHCSSVGEFEQARPLIEKIKREGPSCQILLTFFSPSGYELRKDYEYADWVYYMPLDTRRDARRFISAVRPAGVIFIKYEFWMNFLDELRVRNIPTYIVCAIFRPRQIFFRWYGGVMRRVLDDFDSIFVQDDRSVTLLSGIGVHNVEICGDTRFDRVDEILRGTTDGDAIASLFASGKRTIVAGSTWWEDEVILSETLSYLPSSSGLILVPHETDSGHISKIEKLFSAWNIVKYSELKKISNPETLVGMVSEARILIVDVVGILSLLYRYAEFAYIGGGFTKSGIHNILEAATYGVPVVFGPRYDKFREAWELIDRGGAMSVSNASDLRNISLVWMADACDGRESERDLAAGVCRQYVADNLGAADRIYDFIFRGDGPLGLKQDVGLSFPRMSECP